METTTIVAADGRLTINSIALALEKTPVERTLPNGKVVNQLVWEGSDLLKVAELLHNHSAEMPEVVDVDGPAPAWLTTALVHEVHPRYVRLNSPDGFIAVGVSSRPTGEGSGPAAFTVTELGTAGNGRRLVKVDFQIDPATPFKAEQLDEVIPPAVGLGDVVVLSGRGPNWLATSIAMAYHGRAAACAMFQPGTGATVAWTHVSDVPLGDIITI